MQRKPFKQKKKICVTCGEEQYIYSKGRCMRCAKKDYAKNKKPKTPKPLKRTMPKKKKRKRSDLQMWKERLDTVFSQYIRLRDSDQDGYCKCFTCEYVGFWKGDNIQCGHFRSRRYNSTRFHEMNCHAQCATCNVYRQGEQYIYGKQLDVIYGDETAEDLLQLSLQTRKFTVEELKELHAQYTQKKEELIKEKGI